MQSNRCSFVLAISVAAAIHSSHVRSVAAADQTALVARVEKLVGQITHSKSGEITAIDLENRGATDDDLKLLSAAPSLQKLIVWGAGITDAGIEHLLGLSQLEDLQLLKTRVSDAGLAKLAALKKLKTLDLQRNTGITNAGMTSVGQI